MTDQIRRPARVAYRLRVAGHLDQHWSAWFGGLVLARDSDGTSTLSGVVVDQAALHGLLAKIRDLGVTLLSVEIIEASDATDGAEGIEGL